MAQYKSGHNGNERNKKKVAIVDNFIGKKDNISPKESLSDSDREIRKEKRLKVAEANLEQFKLLEYFEGKRIEGTDRNYLVRRYSAKIEGIKYTFQIAYDPKRQAKPEYALVVKEGSSVCRYDKHGEIGALCSQLLRENEKKK